MFFFIINEHSYQQDTDFFLKTFFIIINEHSYQSENIEQLPADVSLLTNFRKYESNFLQDTLVQILGPTVFVKCFVEGFMTCTKDQVSVRVFFYHSMPVDRSL